MLEADKYIQADTSEFATYFSPTRSGLRDIWSFVKSNITYQEDPPKMEAIKSPAMLWDIRVGDCKSFTLFTASILKNLGVPYRYRFAQYRGHRYPTHVYLVATLDGQDIIMDSVHHSFDSEEIYEYAHDYDHITKAKRVVEYRLGSLPASNNIGLYIIAGLGLYYFTNLRARA